MLHLWRWLLVGGSHWTWSRIEVAGCTKNMKCFVRLTDCLLFELRGLQMSERWGKAQQKRFNWLEVDSIESMGLEGGRKNMLNSSRSIAWIRTISLSIYCHWWENWWKKWEMKFRPKSQSTKISISCSTFFLSLPNCECMRTYDSKLCLIAAEFLPLSWMSKAKIENRWNWVKIENVMTMVEKSSRKSLSCFLHCFQTTLTHQKFLFSGYEWRRMSKKNI